ncbi:calmodulin-binding transcription activator 1-like [Electrophorus electricus]|uniref:calmodulin-binding transcription activator 1-like n=1 Tax=Electrophorus electricus TaxID=8005 RepID=UPI0015D00C57|nr:calmodulin-binding transcription activator 1-like [Electrophorus electricus]
MAAENKPEGLKRMRNPDRTYRAAVGYASHAPPKGVGDDAGANNEHGHLKIYLPKKLLECLPKCSSLPKERHRWNTNEEIAAYLISFEKHEEWLTTAPKTRPQNGSMILYNRKKVKYRKDGYCWKKRKDGKTTREDHMKLKVQGVECLYGCYVHSSIIPTFHRRCYWLLQNPDIVLVHYLNVPAIEDCGKPCGPILCSINTDKKEWAKWTKEELISQLKPMFHGIKWTCSNGNSSSGFSAEQLVQQILDSHQTKPPPRTHNCLCTGTLGAGSSLHHKCNSAKHRIISPKVEPRTGGAYGSSHSEVQNSDVSEGQTDHGHGTAKTPRAAADGKRNGKVPKPALLHQNSMEVSSTNQVEVPDTTQSSPVSISSGLNSDPDVADSPVVTGMGHVASVMSSLSQSATVFMSEVAGDPVYSMSPSGDPGARLLGPDAASGSLVLAVTSDTHKFAFPGAVSVGLGDVGSGEGLAMLSAASVSEELALSSSLESGSIKLPETTMNFDPDCFLNNPKQGQTYGGNGMKTENGATSSCSNGGVGCSPPLADNNFAFDAALVENIKTEDTSFEQQLAKDGGYQVGEMVSSGGGLSSSSTAVTAQSSLALTATGSLLPSGGGLSPSTTLEQMDFSAIDAKQDFSSSVMSAAGYGQTLAQQGHSPRFYLQGSPQSTQSQAHQNSGGAAPSSHDSYMGLSVVKTDSTNANGHLHLHHLHHAHQGQHAASTCNGSSPAERCGQGGALQLMRYPNRFSSKEHEEAERLERPASREAAEGQEEERDPRPRVGNEAEGRGATERYLRQAESSGLGPGGGAADAGAGGGALCNGTDGSGVTGSPQQPLQPLLQGTGLVQGLFGTVAAHQGLSSGGTAGGGTMEINLDHFDVSFGNQFSDLINDFIAVEGGSVAGVGAQAGTALYSHQLMAHPGAEGQVSTGTPPQQDSEEGGGYGSADLCLQACCSPRTARAGPGPGDAAQLAYMQVEEAVSAAVAQEALGLLQATGRVFVVTDYSPEWSYPEGGVKVLITGPWQEADSDYSCLFDQITVPASLIQPGVLRCYCPAHDTGLVALQVAASSQIISNSVVFEYKARALPALPTSQHDWLSLDDNQFRMSILERLEQMERRMAEMASQQQPGGGAASESGVTDGGRSGVGDGRGSSDQSQFSTGPGQTQAGSSFESRVVVVCEKMMNRTCWAKSKHLIHSKTFRGMTLLHLAAAQGYATLIQTLIKWRNKHADSIDLELEVDPLNVDHFSCTPLMWACALGHTEAAVALYKWDRRALAIPDSLGRLPLATARSRGHTKLAECLENLQREEQQQQPAGTTTPNMPFPQSAESSTTEGWMDVWSSESAPVGLRGSSMAASASSANPDLRRPRSEPSGFYPNDSQGDAPLTKKHKPNPQSLHPRQGKFTSDEQVLHTPACSPKRPLEGGVDQEAGRAEPSHAKLASACGAVRWGARQALGQAAGRRGPVTGFAKERLACRLRLREAGGAGTVSELLASQEGMDNPGDLQTNIMTLAEHIIEATPDHIKSENFVSAEAVTLDSVGVNNTMSWLATYLGDAERFLHSEPLAPPAGVAQPESDGPLGRLTLPSPADWSAFLNASHSKEEQDLARLALSDHEQRELYEAARQVQSTFRKSKGRPLREQQELAAAVIQRCYKKYKQLTWIALKYALYKKMTQAAILIQSKFRSYHEQKKFQQSRRAAVLIQQYYRSYRELGRPAAHTHAAAAAVLVQHKLRSGLLTKRQDQAARKILRFLLRCRHSPLVDHRLYKRGERIEKGQGT